MSIIFEADAVCQSCTCETRYCHNIGISFAAARDRPILSCFCLTALSDALMQGCQPSCRGRIFESSSSAFTAQLMLRRSFHHCHIQLKSGPYLQRMPTTVLHSIADQTVSTVSTLQPLRFVFVRKSSKQKPGRMIVRPKVYSAGSDLA